MVPMHLFYYEESDLSQVFESGNKLVKISGDDAAHIRVMRLRKGDEFLVTDGLGNICTAVLEESEPKYQLAYLKDIRSFTHPSHHIHIAIAPPKNIARFEWFLEKATEAGIDEITPFFSENSERTNIRPERLNKILVSAMKQSLKTFLPVINEPVSFEKLISANKSADNCFIAWLDRNNRQHHFMKVCKPNMPVTILIGPEGDFTPVEVEQAINKGFIPVSLGSSRLRTETAALASCFMVNILNEPDETKYPLSKDQ